MSYSKQRRDAVLKKLLPPYNKSMAELAKEEGISVASLYQWRKAARAKGQLLPANSGEPEGWSTQDKFNAVLETAALSEAELAQYCRSRGLYPEQIRRWRSACEQVNDLADGKARQDADCLKAERKRSKALERELRRKEAALAETAALLTLRKKANAIWWDEEE